MRKITLAVSCILFTAVSLQASLVDAVKASSLDPKVKSYVESVLIPFTQDKTVIAAVKAQNAKGRTLDEIKKIDNEWKNAEDFLPIQEELTDNDCAKAILELIAKHPEIKEAFVMDNQGANVGQNDLTSDFWQGDEAKWQKSFNGGAPSVDIGKVELDESSNATLQQVSLAVEEGGKSIGAITFGLDISAIK